MKRTFANLVQKSLVAALLVFGALLFSTSRAEAQSSGAETWPTNWVDNGEAMNRIFIDVMNLHADPTVEITGSVSYIKVHYYKFVYNRLNAGEPVYSAITNPLANTAFRPMSEDIPGVSLNQGQRNDLINDMKTRLSN
jgi:hypothetical protein